MCRKYQEQLEFKFEDEKQALLAQYFADKKIDEMMQENRRIQENAENQHRENMARLKKLEQETQEATKKLSVEHQKYADQQQKHQQQLKKVQDDMKAGHEADRRRYDEQISQANERYNQLIQQNAERDQERDRQMNILTQRLANINQGQKRQAETLLRSKIQSLSYNNIIKLHNII